MMDAEYVRKLLAAVASRNKCLTRNVAAILVKDDMIISTGYNGTPKGWKNCTDGGCFRCQERMDGLLKSGEKLDECLCVHAEANAIAQAAWHGIATAGSILYVSAEPCLSCRKIMVNAGVRWEVVKRMEEDKECEKKTRHQDAQIVRATWRAGSSV